MTLSLLDARNLAGQVDFSNRVAAAMSIAAAAVYSELGFAVTSGPTLNGNKVLSFGSVPGWVTPGASLSDLSLPSAIASGTIVTGISTVGGTTSVTMSNVVTGTIGTGDAIGFPGHTARARFANQVSQGNYNLLQACLAVLSNPTLISEGTTAEGSPSTNGIPDTDLQFAVNSVFTLLAGA